MWGLAFKPDTDDIREAPALYMIDALVNAGATVTAFDPEGMENVKKLKGDKMSFAKDEYEALKGADALIIATEWALFRTPDFARVGELLKEKIVFDGRNLYDLDEMERIGFSYVSVGRNAVNLPVSAKA
jgi:UDPglucose 6-dehydrogenase